MSSCRFLKRPFVLWGVLFIAMAISDSELFADLNTYRIKTVEWLVDNSDVIAVVRESTDAAGARPAVLSTLKGNADRVQWPLPNPRRTDKKGYQIYGPKSDGPVRLVFVQGTSTLLDAVALGREQPISTPSIHDIFYGVTQYGDLILTPSRLFQVVQARIRTGPGEALPRKPSTSPVDHDAVWAPADFPLEASDECYLLIVPFTVERRDHYVRILRTGDAAARIQAIRELSRFADDTAVAAIREALGITDVILAYRYSWDRQRIETLTSADVRLAAKTALAQQ